MDIRQGLAKRVGDGVAWRTAAEGAPTADGEPADEEANRRSADALKELADHMLTLSPSDSRLQAMGELTLREDTFPGDDDEVDKLIAHYGTNRHLQTHPDTFLRAVGGVVDRQAHMNRARPEKN